MNYSELISDDWAVISVLEKQKRLETYLSKVVPNVNPFLFWTDSYKVSHINFEVEGVKDIYSNASVRFATYMKELLGDYFDNQFVVFGMQWMMLRFHMMAKTGFFDRPKAEVIQEMKDTWVNYIGEQDLKHFEDLHDLGYLPLIVKSLDEGTIAPVGMPFYTIENTLPQFRWLSNYIESGMSTDTWKQLTVATVAYAFRRISNKFAMETQGNLEGTEFQNHDFSTRGQSGFESGAINGVAFSLSSNGSDNMPSLWAARDFYQTVNESPAEISASISAGEHSVTTLGILVEVEKAKRNGEVIDNVEGEYRYKKMLLTERFPNGFFSDVADSFDYWAFITTSLPRLKDEIMARDGKYVVRGDSGNPVHIIAGYRVTEVEALNIEDYYNKQVRPYGLPSVECIKTKDGRYYSFDPKVDAYGEFSHNRVEITESEAKGTIQCLWEIFGGTENDLGYKHLDSHIGMIYGDGITVSRSAQILTRLKEKGFASTNIVFGVGSYSLNVLSRDHLGIAIKATNAIIEIDGEDVDTPIYKDPATDSSKKSDRGYLVVDRDENGVMYKKDMQSREAMMHTGLLYTLYMNGQFHKLTDLRAIKKRMWAEKKTDADRTPEEITKEVEEFFNLLNP